MTPAKTRTPNLTPAVRLSHISSQSLTERQVAPDYKRDINPCDPSISRGSASRAWTEIHTFINFRPSIIRLHGR
jgi:hypothetical protein